MISDITVIYSNNNLFIRKQAIYLLIRIDYYLLECCILFFNLMNLLSAYQVIYFEMKSIFWRSTMRNISRNKFWWYAADKINKLMSYIHLKFAFLKIIFIERVIILVDIKLRGLGRKNEWPAMCMIFRVKQTATQACFTRWIALNGQNNHSSGPSSKKSQVKKSAGPQSNPGP